VASVKTSVQVVGYLGTQSTWYDGLPVFYAGTRVDERTIKMPLLSNARQG